jgi:hypothetical protein
MKEGFPCIIHRAYHDRLYQSHKKYFYQDPALFIWTGATRYWSFWPRITVLKYLM